MKNLFKTKAVWIFLFMSLIVLNLVPLVCRKNMTIYKEVNNFQVDGTDVCISIVHKENDDKIWVLTSRNGTPIFDQTIYYRDDRIMTSMMYFDQEGNYCEVMEFTGDGIPDVMLMDTGGDNFRRLYFIGGEFKEGTVSECKLLIDGRETEVVNGRYKYVE